MASLVLSKRLAVQKQSFSFESLAGHDVSERITQAEAHCERNFNCQTHIASLFKLRIFVDIIIKARVASLKVTEFFFCLRFLYKLNKPEKLLSLLLGCLLFVNLAYIKFSEFFLNCNKTTTQQKYKVCL